MLLAFVVALVCIVAGALQLWRVRDENDFQARLNNKTDWAGERW